VTRTAWAVFTRAARRGEVKTRLAARYGPEAALLVHRVLLRRTLAVVERMPGERSLWVFPEEDPWSRRLARSRGWILRRQEGEDLGARMAHAVRALLATHDGVVLVGGDLPCLREEMLARLASALAAGGGLAFLPAFDGGYGALALASPPPGILEALFDAHAWGEADVLRSTRLALRRMGLDPVLLPPTPDWDRPGDLAFFVTRLPRSLVRRLDRREAGGRDRESLRARGAPAEEARPAAVEG
jgi:rSAM/selenodomain-associated transferase 1